MLLTPETVELLAPAGTWDSMVAAIDAGANAVYLGGKRFNMRQQRTDTNFTDEKLRAAITFAHQRNVKIYITVNNLISDKEIEPLKNYLTFLNEIGPDSLIVQDLALLKLAKELNLNIPLHASVMMNTHNEQTIRLLQSYGISRVVVCRELSLTQIALLKEKTGIEVEYFIHGDMCVAHSGQCLHSGILFGQSSNRGRCLKPCRWPYQLINEINGEVVSGPDPGPYKLAMKDMCMYTALPELIQAGVCSFKIEGRMRTPDFIHRIVSSYRSAIDRYIADPSGYTPDSKEWKELYEYRSRDFSTCYALGNPGAASIGYSGQREPRFFSQAVLEAGLETAAIPPAATEKAISFSVTPVTVTAKNQQQPLLAVRVANQAALAAACANGADAVYIGGEAFKPNIPWTLAEISAAVITASQYNCKVIVTTPRITMERQCGELEQLFNSLAQTGCHGVLVSNPGLLLLAKQMTTLPVQADFSCNVFNHLTAGWLQDNGVVKATASLEATYEQIAEMVKSSSLPLEIIVHGSLEVMVLDHCLPAAVTGQHTECYQLCEDKSYALLDTAGQHHRLKIDQFCRNHVLMAKDLCLLPHLQALYTAGVTEYRLEAQHYQPEHVALLSKIYRQELDKIAANQQAYNFDRQLTTVLAASSPTELGIGAFRYRISR